MGCDENHDAKAYENLVKENIDYDNLIITKQYDVDVINGIVELIVETELAQSDTILIASERYPTALVKSKLLKLNYCQVKCIGLPK